MYHILRTAEKKTRDLPLIPLSVVNCASAGTLPAEAESLRPLRGRLNKLGARSEGNGLDDNGEDKEHKGKRIKHKGRRKKP